jgi:hypothetical protein
VTDVVVVHRATHGQPWLNRRKIASSTISQKGMMLRVFRRRSAERRPRNHICAIRMHDFASCNCKAPLPRRGRNGTALALRDFDLGGAKPILPGGRSVRCSLLNQQAFRLEKKFEMDHGFHRGQVVAFRHEAGLRGTGERLAIARYPLPTVPTS